MLGQMYLYLTHVRYYFESSGGQKKKKKNNKNNVMISPHVVSDSQQFPFTNPNTELTVPA